MGRWPHAVAFRGPEAELDLDDGRRSRYFNTGGSSGMKIIKEAVEDEIFI